MGRFLSRKPGIINKSRVYALLFFDVEIREDSCTKNCPFKEFYFNTIGKAKELPTLIERRNAVNKVILKNEEILNLYNNLIFIKNHIISYEKESSVGWLF